MCVCVCVLCVCVRACVRVCVRVLVRERACVRARERALVYDNDYEVEDPMYSLQQKERKLRPVNKETNYRAACTNST